MAKELTETPLNNEKVEVLVGGRWRPATFHEADYDEDEDAEEAEEMWPIDCFELETGDAIPYLRSTAHPNWRRRAISASPDIERG